MKKILTFVCAVVLALTANAGTMKKMSADALHPQHRDLNAPVKNHSNARRMAMEKYSYVIEDYLETYYANYGVLQIDMNTPDGYYSFHFVFDGINKLEDGKTYTFDDCYEDPTYGASYYTYADDNYYGDYLDYESFTLVGTIDPSTGLKNVVANVVDIYGDTYELTYNEPAKPESFTDVPLTMNQVKIYDETATYGYFQAMGMNDAGYYASLVVESNNIVGSYTTSDMMYLNQDYTVLYYGENMIRLCDAELEVTAGANEGDYNMTANLYGYDGNKYIITMNYIVPVITETIPVNCTNLNIEVIEFYGMFLGGEMTASNADYSLSLELDAKTGTFEDLLVLTDVASGNEIDLFSSSITIASAFAASGEALGMDGKYYVFTLSFPIPDPTETISFTAPAGEYEYYEETADYYITGYSADYTYGIALDIFTDNLVGTYDLADLDDTYSFVYQFDNEGNTVEQWSFLSCSAVITQNQDGTYKCVMTAQGLGTTDKTSSPSFSITIDNISVAEYHPDYDEDAPCISEVFDEYAVDNSYLPNGMVFVDAFNDNVTASIAFIVNPGAGLVPGTYVIADTQEEGTVAMGAFDEGVYPSYVATLGDGGLSTPIWYFISGTVTVEDNMDIVVDAFNSYNQPIQFTLPHAATGLDRHHINGNVMKYFHNNHLIIRANDKHYMMSGWAF